MNKGQKINILKIILSVVQARGILTIALVAQNVAQEFKFSNQSNKKYNPKYYIIKKVMAMIKKGFLKKIDKNNIPQVVLTKKGQNLLRKYLLKEHHQEKKKWDGKWRIFTFDVWERCRRKRDLLRNEIKDFGFIQLQKSVWLYPFECGEFIELLKSDLNFGKNVRYMVVEKLDKDQALRKYFNLI